MFYQTQAARRPPKGPENAAFLSLVTLTLKLVTARNQTCLPCEFGANPFSSSEIFCTQTKKITDWQCQKQNLPQFTACGKKKLNLATVYNSRPGNRSGLFVQLWV